MTYIGATFALFRDACPRRVAILAAHATIWHAPTNPRKMRKEKMEKFFHLKENGTTVSTEIMAGLTTFFAMSYIIIVNPQILSSTGMPWGGVFLATIIAAIIGTLVMGLFANVPYAQAAGMGLNAFFTYTVCFGLGFKWQETLCMVFLCGLINIIITVTKIRKMIIQAIPEVLQNAIGGGIGLFVAYVASSTSVSSPSPPSPRPRAATPCRPPRALPS